MKLKIKFPNGDTVEVDGYEASIEALKKIQEEDNTIVLECEITNTISNKTTGKPNFVIDFLETQTKISHELKRSNSNMLDLFLGSSKRR